jgi:hypothetical protein
MAAIALSSDSLVVTVNGADRIWALKSELVIPLEHVVGASKDEDEARRWWHGLRAPGTSIPGVITAGTFYKHGERVFWDVHHPERAIAISLRDESYAKLVVEVEDPDAAVAATRGCTTRKARLSGQRTASAQHILMTFLWLRGKVPQLR